MELNMNHENIDIDSNFFHITELKEKVKSLVSEVKLNRETTKFKQEKTFDNYLSDLTSNDENEDEFLDLSRIESQNETNWLLEEDSDPKPVNDICKLVYADVDDNLPEVSNLYRQLEALTEPHTFGSQKASIDSRTYTRPKKCTTRPPLLSVLNFEEGRPKLQRRLTTTITPSPNLISKLEELSKNNNRPVSGNYNNVKWEDGSEECMAEIKKPVSRTKRQSLPASLFDRLQELKKANSSFKIPDFAEPNGSYIDDGKRNHLLDDAKKVTAALDIDLKNPNSSRLSEIFRNTQDYYSDDNESFISLDEVSGFCDRLTLSTDQNTYSSIVREMEQHEICLFHRPLSRDKSKGRTNVEDVDIFKGDLSKNANMSHSFEEDIDLNRTYEIDEEESNNKNNDTFELQKNLSKHNIMNATYDANKKPGLIDAILQSDIIKNLSPNQKVKKNIEGSINDGNDNIKINNNNNNNSFTTATSNITNTINTSNNNNGNINYNNNNNNNNINKNNNLCNKVSDNCRGTNVMNYTYQKHNSTLDQNELNVLHAEKYSTQIFDSSFGKAETDVVKSSARKSSGKKDQSDQSEDDCMSTTSDNSYRSADSNSEAKSTKEIRYVIGQQRKKFSSTPIMGQTEKLDFDVVSPIKMEIGGGEYRAFSNPFCRGNNSGKGIASINQEETQKQRTTSNLKLPLGLKVPQKELKLKPALIRPSQNFKRPLFYARTSSEPSVPQKIENFQPVASVPILRPVGPVAVPSLTNIRPSTRASGIPRPPTRLKQPQIRVSYSKK